MKNLTTDEYGIIGASLRYTFEDRFQCMSKEFKSDLQLDLHTKRNNCYTEIKDKRSYYKFDYLLFNKCFCNFYNPQVQLLINISQHLDKYGNFPIHLYPITRISAKYQKVHNIIQTYISELRALELKKQQDKIKNKR